MMDGGLNHRNAQNKDNQPRQRYIHQTATNKAKEGSRKKVYRLKGPYTH
jgi:hypothetical protein